MQVFIIALKQVASPNYFNAILVALIASVAISNLTKKTIRKYKYKLLKQYVKQILWRFKRKKSEGTAYGVFQFLLKLLLVIVLLILIGIFISWYVTLGIFLVLIILSFIL